MLLIANLALFANLSVSAAALLPLYPPLPPTVDLLLCQAWHPDRNVEYESANFKTPLHFRAFQQIDTSLALFLDQSCSFLLKLQ